MWWGQSDLGRLCYLRAALRPLSLRALGVGQVGLAAELGLPLFVHLRERGVEKGEALGAYADALEILGRYSAAVPV